MEVCIEASQSRPRAVFSGHFQAQGQGPIQLEFESLQCCSERSG